MIYHFGSFVLDQPNAELRKDGHRVLIARQPLLLLMRFVARPGALVSRGELERVLWPSGTALDTGQGLNAAIRKLRRALGDGARTPRYLETVPQFGYRFTAKVTVSNAADEGRRWRPGFRGARAGVIGRGTRLVASLLIGVFVGASTGSAPKPDTVLGSSGAGAACRNEITVPVAVLAIRSESPDDRLDRLAEALTDDLIGALWNVSGVRLVAARQRPGGTPPASGLRLASEVRTQGDSLFLHYRVSDIGTGRTVRERRISAPATAPYLLRDLVARDVSRVASSWQAPVRRRIHAGTTARHAGRRTAPMG